MKYFASWLVFVIPTAETAHPVFFTQEGFFFNAKASCKITCLGFKTSRNSLFPRLRWENTLLRKKKKVLWKVLSIWNQHVLTIFNVSRPKRCLQQSGWKNNAMQVHYSRLFSFFKSPQVTCFGIWERPYGTHTLAPATFFQNIKCLL